MFVGCIHSDLCSIRVHRPILHLRYGRQVILFCCPDLVRVHTLLSDLSNHLDQFSCGISRVRWQKFAGFFLPMSLSTQIQNQRDFPRPALKNSTRKVKENSPYGPHPFGTKKRFLRSFLYDCTRYPFNWKTVTGYLAAWISECAGSATIAFSITQFLNLFMGSCWLFIHIADDITKDLVAFNIDVRAAKQNHAESMERFRYMVQIYSDAKQ